MDRNQAKEEVKEKLPEYLRMKGIKTLSAFPCFNPGHNDKHPSMGLVSTNRKKGTGVNVHCKGCGATYDIIDLIKMDYGISDDRSAFDKAYELFNIKIDSYPDIPNYMATKPKDWGKKTEESKEMDGQNQDKTGQNTATDNQTHTHTHTDEQDNSKYYDECKRRINDTDYHRGLSAETLERHWIGFEPDFKTRDAETNKFISWRALIIPTDKESYTVRNTDTNASKKNRYRNRGGAKIFNKKTLQTAKKPILIVEGEIDAMSVEEAGGEAVGLGSLDNINLFIRMLEAKKPSQPLIIALDQEAEPDKQKMVNTKEQELIDGLERLQIPYYKLRPFAGYHDANEALTKDREAFIEAIARAENIEKQAEEEEKEAYLSTSAGANLQQFINGIAESVNTPCISTGFEKLDSIIDGGLYEGLIAIGAITSLGKTSLVLQIADQVAEIGNDVLIFSLEMARSELMSKSISRQTLRIALADGIDTSNAKTARGITDGKRHKNYSRTENKLIQDAISSYSSYAERIYIQEGIGDIGTDQIKQTIEKHIRFTGRRPLVIVDYLQLIAPYNVRATDKQNTDKCVLELKRISRDFKVPVIAISSFNRTNYSEAVTLEAFKESGGIEYGCDIVIGLQLKGAGKKDFDPTVEKKKNPRQVELVILKNRQGKVGDKVLFDFYPMFNYFIEKELS